MSKIEAAILRDKTNGIEVPMAYPVAGSAKSYINFSTAPSTAIRKSLNVSSIVDEGLGVASANFASVMIDNIYAAASGGNAGGYSTYGIFSNSFVSQYIFAYTSLAYRMAGQVTQGSNAYIDVTNASGVIVGELA